MVSGVGLRGRDPNNPNRLYGVKGQDPTSPQPPVLSNTLSPSFRRVQGLKAQDLKRIKWPQTPSPTNPL